MTEHEKTGRRVLRLVALLLLSTFTIGVSAQTPIETVSPFGGREDSINCPESISNYKACYASKDLNKAMDLWRQVLAVCPASSEDIYIDGESMYTELFTVTGDFAYIDSILTILSMRTYYFNNNPSNDLHKAVLLSDLAGDDPTYLGLCYNIIIEAADSYPEQMGCSHFVLLATTAASLYAMGIIDADELAHAFVKAIGTVEERMEHDADNCAGYEDLENMETFFRTSGAMTCASLEMMYSQKIDRNFRDTVLINKVFSMLTETDCTGSDLYYNVAVKMFANNRTAENAVRLAELNVSRNNIERAISYFTEAYNRDTSRLVRSEVITRVAVMELAQGKRQEARDRAEHAWQLNNRNARALLILADCYAGAELGNTFDNHTAYWVAVDYLEAAIKVDPSLRKEAEGKIKAYSQLFPTKEECFYRRLNDQGAVFNVGSWIGEVTRVRFRRE